MKGSRSHVSVFLTEESFSNWHLIPIVDVKFSIQQIVIGWYSEIPIVVAKSIPSFLKRRLCRR